VKLKGILKEKCRGKFTKVVLVLHDKATAHGALATQKKLAYLGFQCTGNPSYSPDLAPSGYHLFPGLKNNCKAAIFRRMRRSLLPRRTGWTDNILIFFSFDLQKSEQRAEKCIELRGEYVEYIPRLVAVACFLPDTTKDLSAPPRMIATGLSVP